MQVILRHAWHSRGEIQVMCKQGKFYIIKFDHLRDKEYIHANGSWVVQGAMLSFVHLRLNIVLRIFI